MRPDVAALLLERLSNTHSEELGLTEIKTIWDIRILKIGQINIAGYRLELRHEFEITD
jgi:hypothetical protein